MLKSLVMVVAGLATGILMGLYAFTGQGVAATPYEVDVWYPGWGTGEHSEYDSLSENIGSVSAVSPYWYFLRSDGTIGTYEWGEDGRVTSLARSNGKAVMPLITNEFDPARVSRMLATKSSRSAHASRLTSLVVNKGYSGIDLDYEMLHAKDRDRYSAFVETLSAKLHAKNKKLSVTVHPKTSEPGTWSGPQAQDWARLGKAADVFRVMIYDYSYNGSNAGPAAPLDWTDDVLTFAGNKVNPSKVRMGIPFYARDWKGTVASDTVFTEARSLASANSATVRRHSSGEPYFEYGDGHTVYYQDATSIGRKLDVLKQNHPDIGGIAIWHIGGEDAGKWNAIQSRLGTG